MATVWAAGAIAALLVVAMLMCWLGSAAVARHRATGAADLAALAAAGKAGFGVDAACDRARWIVGQMAARLVSCRFERWDALVEVESSMPGVPVRLGSAGARARAGPVDSTPP